jgi:Xaa-Pro aminopeptidase
LTSSFISLSFEVTYMRDMERGERIQAILDRMDLEGVIIFSPENIRYLTGFSGGEGYLLMRHGENLLMVDGRYITQAEEETRGCCLLLLDKGIRGVTSKLSSLGLKRVGFEAENISVALFGKLQEGVEGVEWIPLTKELERLRGVKTAEEIVLIQGAVNRAESALERIVRMVKPGIREDELAIELEYIMRQEGGEGVAFEIIVASGPRSALPHAQPTSRRLKEGDLVLFDFGSRYHGYNSDESCTFVLGRSTQEQRTMYHTVLEAHNRALDRVKRGVKLAEIDTAAREHINDAGHGEHFGHNTGHGVGLAVHEWPAVGKDSQDVVEEGMVFTIEPGIYIPGWGGVRIEDMVLVTPGGYEILTKIPKNLIEL